MTKVASLTKRKSILTFVRMLGALLLVAMALHSAPAFAGDVCNNADLDGAYAYYVGGTAVNVPTLGPVAILGKVTVDGRGHFAGTVNGGIAGAFNLTDLPITGSYSIADDCTGSWTTNYPSITIQWSLVLVDDLDGRKHAELVETDLAGVSTGTVKPMFASAQNNQGN